MTLHDIEVGRSRTFAVATFQWRAKVHAFVRSV